jgi:hypothetical protein
MNPSVAFSLAALVACAPLAACAKRDSDPAPAAVTVDEACALKDAEAMLDARRPPNSADALPATTRPCLPRRKSKRPS